MAGNGIELSPARQAAYESGLLFHQQVAAERDALLIEVRNLRSEIAGYKVAAEAQAAQMNGMESRIATMQLVRDQAVAERATYEALFVTLQAQMRAFKIPAAPLIKKLVTDGIEDAAG